MAAALGGASSAEERTYAEAVRRVLDSSWREFGNPVDLTDHDADAVARMRAARPPAGREVEHEACVSAFAAHVEAMARHRRAMLARDRETARAAWEHVDATNAHLGEALHRASPD